MTSRFLGIFALGAAIAFSAPAYAADTYSFDPTHTSVIWSAVHFGKSSPHGIFSNIEGTLVVDEAAPEKSTVDVKIPTGMIATGIETFDNHLKSADFFNVEKFPAATFKSTRVEKTGDKTARVTGDLTLLGVTRPAVLDVTFNDKGVNPMNNKETIGFSATTTIKRSEWGINYALPHVSDDIPLTIEAEATK